MKYYVIADSYDTIHGLRLAGIEGEYQTEKADVQAAISRVIGDPELGILLITEGLAQLCPELIYELKLKTAKTLVVEIPHRFGTARTADSITKYIREAIGIKV